MQVSLSSNGHEKLKKLVNIKKLLISKRRIGILKNYLNKVKIVRVCDFIIFEIPILTVEMIYVVDHTLSYCQNRESNIIKSHSHYLHLV